MFRWLFASEERAIAFLYATAWMSIVFVVSSLPGALHTDERWIRSLLEWLLPLNTDLLHVPGYAVLALLWCRALRAWRIRTELSALLGFLIAVGFGLLMEWHQGGIPGRASEASDAALNAAGALMTAGLYMLGARLAQARGSRPS